jgi:hypothetical protein
LACKKSITSPIDKIKYLKGFIIKIDTFIPCPQKEKTGIKGNSRKIN